MTRSSSTEDYNDIPMKSTTCADSFWCRQFKNILPMYLFRNNSFLLLIVTFTMWTAQSATLTYLPQLAVSLDIPRSDAAHLISVVGIANVGGRLFAGMIVDCLRVRGIWLYVAALILAAGINLAIPFSTSYLLLQVYSALFGLSMAVAVSMRTIVLAEQLGIDVLTESFGVVALFQGVAFTVNPPLAGMLIDEFDSYKPPFLMAAIMYAISALCSAICGCLAVAQSRRMRNRQEICSILVESLPVLEHRDLD